MDIRVYRSLDRSVQFFGITGRFLMPMAAGAVLSLVAACAVGGATNGLVGVALFLILFFVCAMLVVSLQGAVTEKALFRKIAMMRCPQYIQVKPAAMVSSWKSTVK